MNELTNGPAGNSDFRGRLMATACALALIIDIPAVQADDESNRPSVWIELGGQLEQMGERPEPFAPPFALITPTPEPYSPISPLQAQKTSAATYGGEGSISFQPSSSGWILSASVRYGRSNGNKHVHQQTTVETKVPYLAHIINPALYPTPTITRTGQRFADTKVKNSESHTILDFQVGKDVGLGIFGRNAKSVVNAGVRFAEFSSASHVTMIARPNVEFLAYDILPSAGKYSPVHDDYLAHADNERIFRGLGPEISWTSSASLIGDTDGAQVVFDWSVNAALLFGRQKASGSSTNSALHFDERYYQDAPPYGASPIYTQPHVRAHDRARSVVVPNIGGTAGLSLKFPNATVSFGYRADFFFGAVDGGINVRAAKDMTLHGPFATISIGLGAQR